MSFAFLSLHCLSAVSSPRTNESAQDVGCGTNDFFPFHLEIEKEEEEEEEE